MGNVLSQIHSYHYAVAHEVHGSRASKGLSGFLS